MTRRSRRELEKATDRLDPQTDDAPADVTIRHLAVDEDGETIGLSHELRIAHRPDGTQTTEEEKFDVPNDRWEGGR